MRSANQVFKSIGIAACVLLLAYFLYQPHSKPQLTIGTVNNADMILMQRLSREFEAQSGVKLNWVVLGENILRQRSTIDISTGGNTFDVITIGSYEAPLWARRGMAAPHGRSWRGLRL